MKKILDIVALALIIIGGINWGLFGLINVDLVAWLLGPASLIARAIYVLIGLAALYAISFLKE